MERDIKISANKNGPNVDEKMGNSQMQTKDCDIKDINNKQGAQTNYGTPFKVQ